VTGHGVREAIGRPAFWTLTLASGLSLMAHGAILAHQVPYLIGRGYSPVFAAGVAGLLGIASLPSRVVLNLLSDRFGPRALLVLSTALLAAGIGLLLLASPGRWYAVWLFVAVYGFAFGAVSPLRASVMADQFGRRAYGSITALQGLPVSVLAAAGPVAAGALYDVLGDYRLAFGLAAAAFVVAMVALVVTPRAGPSSQPVHAPAAV